MAIITRVRALSIVPVLLLLTLGLFSANIAPVNASIPPTNLFMNPSFENGVDGQGIPDHWTFLTCEGVGNATARLDSTTSIDGNRSARVYSGPITNDFCI